MASESELSQTLPDESIIEQTLRAIVQNKRDDATLSVKKVRTAAEEQLGLDANFFKTDEKWKAKSQEIINDAFVRVAPRHACGSLPQYCSYLY